MINREDLKSIILSDIIIDSVGGEEQKEGWHKDVADMEMKLNDMFYYMSDIETASCAIKISSSRVKKIVIALRPYGYRSANIMYVNINKARDGDIYEHIENIIDNIYEGVENMMSVTNKMDLINELCSNELNAPERKVIVRYTWGYGNYCVIDGWDQTKLDIKLNKDAVKWIANADENSIRECFKDDSAGFYLLGVNKIIHNFTECEFHKQSGAKLESAVVSEELKRNMLNISDMIDIILNKKNDFDGIQNIRFCMIVYMLGTFIAICACRVDYGDKKLELELVNVYDVESEAFTRGDMFNRVEKLMNLNRLSIEKLLN